MKERKSTKTIRVVVVALVLGGGTLSFSPLPTESYTFQNTSTLEPLRVTIAGTISPTTFLSMQRGTVSFNRFPADVEEFEWMQEQIGLRPHGAVALQIMAYEMFRRNRAIGQTCIRMNNTTSNVMGPTNRLSELYGNTTGYARPYQMAAFLKGATPKNGYNPAKPYKVEVRVNRSIKYQYSNDYQTNVIYLQVLTQGKSHGAEGVSVLRTLRPGEPGNGEYFIVLDSPGLYSQVLEASFANPFRGLE